MAANRFKAKQSEGAPERGFFGFLSTKLKLTELETGFPVKYLPKVLFAVLLGVCYVWNSHYAERTTREIDRLEDEVEDLRADVTTLEADYMFSSKQSEVARRVQQLGLEESKEPPIKIIVDSDEY
ncbi:hypothetical protein BXY85_0958 [Roseivirga pacifica]|uniref:Cell division protein FtsL n=1 Tax=Roseivirga pacifica TaxID=1267423 RepID=A0A1I0RNN5_9BACT|nr:FtsL-like putative cell division protein [Roseivirga pacifica]MCO6358258.1 hypothetical protein [Roseivirga pacifica]MCO6366278.1 hypothetical protein [Roseivirga pacifica]MCO6369171.1 hypothetical protein [Roseivirga pacifica]MCO6373989.1 hypothetical protein [Roseivirga pacifica]MCO6378365.1 hypothetical protein [Roseivirga pacifica]